MRVKPVFLWYLYGDVILGFATASIIGACSAKGVTRWFVDFAVKGALDEIGATDTRKK